MLRVALLTLLGSAAAASSNAVDRAREEAAELRRDAQQQKAQARLRAALSQLTAAQGADASLTEGHAQLLSDLAKVYTDQGKETEAIAAGEEAVEIYTQLFGLKDGRRTMEMDRLAQVHMAFKRHSAAADLLAAQISAMRAMPAMPPEAFQQALARRGQALLGAGANAEAAEAFKELVTMLTPLVNAAVENAEEAVEGAEEAARDRLAETQLQAARALAMSAAPMSAKRKKASRTLEEALGLATAARDAYASLPSRRQTMTHAFALNGVAGILERQHRHEEAIHAMEQSVEMARTAADATPHLVTVGERSLAGMRKKIKGKEAQERAAEKARLEKAAKARLEKASEKAEL